jgi:hypothetical protein
MRNQKSGTLHAGAIAAKNIHGVALANPMGALGITAIPMLPEYGLFTDKLLFTTLEELGPHDPQDRYHRIAFKVPTTREAVNRYLGFEHFKENGAYHFEFEDDEATRLDFCWFRKGDCVYARVNVNAPLEVMMVGSGWLADAPAEEIRCDTVSVHLSRKDLSVVATFSRPALTRATADKQDQLEAKLRGFALPEPAAPVMAGHTFTLTPEEPLYYTLSPEPLKPDIEMIEEGLAQGLKACRKEGMQTSGRQADCAEAIQDLVGFMKTYDPAKDLYTVPVNRAWGSTDKVATVFCWDNFFDSYLAALFDPALAKDSLRYIIKVLEDDFENSPPQRNLIVPIIYSKTIRMMDDWEYAAETFPGMMNFMRFWFSLNPQGHPWRDGNDDGLIECGTQKTVDKYPMYQVVQCAFDETGYDDSPMYSDGFAYERRGIPAKGIKFDFTRGTLNLTMIGQNALYVTACRSMALVADKLYKEEDAAWLRSEAERVAERIKERLFCPEKGYFQNRFFDGEFSDVKTMTLFYPLLAEVCDDETKERLREILLDPKQFWGEYVIPTVSRDDPAYRCPQWDHAEQWKGNYWRGYIWGPTNYITYLSIRHAEWDGIAAEFAQKSRTQFLEDWREHRIATENYPPEGRTNPTAAWFANGGRCPHYAWACCMPLTSLEELFSVEDTVEGIRFGTLEPSNFGSWENFSYRGENSSIRVDEQGLDFSNGSRLQVTSDQPIAIRAFCENGNTVSFKYRCTAPAMLCITIDGKATTNELPASPDSLVEIELRGDNK